MQNVEDAIEFSSNRNPRRKLDVSVVINTWNRRVFLREALESFFHQTLSSHRFEVIIVDNDSDDGTGDMVKELQGRAPFCLRYFCKENEGPAAAINLGIARACSPILAKTDDDCVVDPRWLEAGLVAFQDPRVAVVEGRIIPRQDHPRSFFDKTQRSTPNWILFCTANIFYRVEALREIGGFDESWWRYRDFRGYPLGGEDIDVGWRLRANRVGHRYSSDTIVYHAVHQRGFWPWLVESPRIVILPIMLKRIPGFRQALHRWSVISWLMQTARLVLLALVSVPLALVFHWTALLLATPYLLSLCFRVKNQRLALLKATLIAVKEVLVTMALLWGSLRYRTPMLLFARPGVGKPGAHAPLSQKDQKRTDDFRVSVTIPTRNQRDRLHEALKAFFHQTLSPHQFEVIVVDNDSDDGTGEMVRELQGRAPFALRYFLKEDEGPAAARNLGIVQARSPIMATTDEDCVVDPRWLEAGLAAFDDPQVTIVEGLIEPRSGLSGLKLKSLQRVLQTRTNWPQFRTTNIFYRIDALRKIGGFDESYWHYRDFIGMPLGGEDMDLGWRLRANGAIHRFMPEAVVYHDVFQGSLWFWLLEYEYLSFVPLLVKRHAALARKMLVVRVFLSPSNFFLYLAAAAFAGAMMWQWWTGLLATPYLLTLGFRVAGTRNAVVKAGALAVKDAFCAAMLLWGSLRHRSLVL